MSQVIRAFGEKFIMTATVLISTAESRRSTSPYMLAAVCFTPPPTISLILAAVIICGVKLLQLNFECDAFIESHTR